MTQITASPNDGYFQVDGIDYPQGQFTLLYSFQNGVQHTFTLLNKFTNQTPVNSKRLEDIENVTTWDDLSVLLHTIGALNFSNGGGIESIYGDVLNLNNRVTYFSELTGGAEGAIYFVEEDEGANLRGWYSYNGVSWEPYGYDTVIGGLEQARTARQSLLNLVNVNTEGLAEAITRIEALESGGVGEQLSYSNTTNLISRKNALMEFNSSSDRGDWVGDLPEGTYSYGYLYESPLYYSALGIEKCSVYANGDADALVEKGIMNIYTTPKYVELSDIGGFTGGDALFVGAYSIYGKTSSNYDLRAKISFIELNDADEIQATTDILGYTTTEIGNNSYAQYMNQELTTQATTTKIKVRLEFAYYQGFTSVVVGKKTV